MYEGDMPNVADQVEAKLSYSLVDWVVTEKEQREVIALLRSDGKLPETLTELHKRGSLKLLVRRVHKHELRRELLDILAAHADATSAGAIRGELADRDVQAVSGRGAVGVTIAEELWQVRFNLIRLGVPSLGRSFDETPFRRVIPSDPTMPFTGQGATGIRPDSRSVPLREQWAFTPRRPA
jgi:hypothetical protein